MQLEKSNTWYKIGNKAFLKNDDGSIIEIESDDPLFKEYKDGELPGQTKEDIIKSWSDNVAKNFLKGLG